MKKVESKRSRVSPEDRLRAQAHVVGLLNEVEAVLTGWVLQEDRELVEKLCGPLYDLCDKD